MSLLCVPLLVDGVENGLAAAAGARSLGADLVEYRIDHIFHGEGDDAGAADAHRLVAESPLPCIVTCRTTEEGGDYDGDDSARISLFESLAASEHPPRYIDVELSTFQRSANLRQKVKLAVDHDGNPRDLRTSLILSSHDFAGRPRDLMQRIAVMRAEPAAKVLKLAFLARSIRDNLELFDLLSERDRPTIALGMGPSGLMSRVLAPKFGGFLTFASLAPTTVTAPGQPTVGEILNTYRFRSIDRDTRVYGVIGHPIAHSLSPLIHNAGFGAGSGAGGDADAINAVYVPMPVAPGWEPFKATLGVMIDHPRLDFSGASVTLPHKEHALRFAREQEGNGWRIDGSAARAGAANTIATRADGTWLVTNTDMDAIVSLSREALADDLRGRRATIVGAGGAARAAAAGLADAGAVVTICNRTVETAERLAAELNEGAGSEAGSIEAAGLEKATAPAALVINCTPVGMAGGEHEGESALDIEALVRANGDERPVVFDTVYNPLETPLLRAARLADLPTIDGASMFVRQAAAQFALWTGREAPTWLFDRLVRERLRSGGQGE